MTDNNPKRARALLDGKDPLDFILWEPVRAICRVLRNGAKKYGIRNWRKEPISASTYEGAIARHLAEWAEGSDEDVDSGEHPLAHVAASCWLVLDSIKQGTFVDDRDRSEIFIDDKD